MNIVKKVFNSEINRNIAKVFSGTLVAQIIPIAISPILTRIYTPEDFGLYSVYFSITAILSILANLRLDLSILLPKKDKEAEDMVWVSILTAIIISGVIGFIVLFAKDVLGGLLNINESIYLLFLLPFTTLFLGASQPLYVWYNRLSNYKTIIQGRIIRSLVTSLSSLSLYFAPLTGLGLILGEMLGHLSASSFLLKKKKNKGSFKSITKRYMDSLERYKNFPKYGVFSGILDKGALNSPAILITSLFNAISSAGFFSLSYRVVASPAAILSNSIMEVFRQEAMTALNDKDSCRNLFVKTFIKLFLIGSPLFLIGYFTIEWLFQFVFGDEWLIAGTYSKIMMPLFFLQFVTSPLSIVIILREKQKYDLLLKLFLFSGTVLSFYITSLNGWGVQTAIQFYTLVYCLKYLVELTMSYLYSKK